MFSYTFTWFHIHSYIFIYIHMFSDKKVEDCSKLIKIKRSRIAQYWSKYHCTGKMMVLKIINFSWETPLKCCKNWLAISRPLESNTTHFRNTGTNRGKEYSTIQMVLYGCNELKRAHLNWVDPILALHTFAHGIVCISYLFISFHIFSYLFTNGRNILQLYLQYSAEVMRLIQTIST